MTLESLWQDIRYAARGLRQKPGFTIAVVITLALGIGANAAMFGITDRLLFRPPAFLQEPDRVHRVYLVRTFDGKENFGSYFQYTRFKDLQRWTSSFDVTAAQSVTETAVGVGADAREMQVGAVSASFFNLFDIRPERGRFFTAAEDTTPVGAAVVVLSYPFWQSRYGGRDDAIGQQLKIAKVDYTIIGVTPPDFAGTATERIPVAWVPITTYAANEFTWNPKDLSNWYQKYNISWMQMFARRKPGVSNDQATADLTNAFRRSYAAQREMSPQTTLAEIAKPRAIAGSILAARGPQPSETSRMAGWVSGVAIIVMLIAAANVANLLLARALRRRREVAVRLALGVSRGRLVAQLLTESILLAVIGGIAGLLVAHWGGMVLRSQFLPRAEDFTVVDSRTLLFAGAAILFVGLITGLAPALQSGRGDLAKSLKSGAREGTYHRSRTRVALLVIQGALSVVLLVGAGLFVRSLDNVRSLRMGYDIDPILWVGVEERGEKLSDAEKSALRDRLAEAARGLPNVANASRAVTVPFYMQWDESIFVTGIDTAKLNGMGSMLIQGAAPEYLETMGTRLLRGRFIQPGDTKDSPKIMVVSQSLATALWPGQEALGQCVRIGADTNPCTEVVGIAEDIRASDEFNKDNKLYYYRPITQTAATSGGMFVRTRSGKAATEAESVRRALQKLMPGSAYVTTQPMAEIFAPTVRSWRLGATMFVAFGLLALVLAAVGLYSVIAYNVVQRTHELGVRVAFGAQVKDVMRLVLGEGLRLTVFGVVVGGAIALYAGRWIAPMLFNVKPTDPVVLGGVVGVLLVTATFASLIPAIRASRVDPNVALRSD
ncbi:MAG TPA: ABC transporter permease [Gemmatimonadaceae bacterium]|nr:ABC transporter permease [Gemmatimonadaceae bacterium]